MPQRSFKRFGKRSEINQFSKVFAPEKTEINEVSRWTNNCGATNNNNERIIPNRVFVGGIPSNASELDVKQKLSTYGCVKAVKIIKDFMGASKGYGFVTFDLEEEAKKALEKNEIILKGKKLHVAPAVRKQNNNYETNTDHSSDAYSLEKYPISPRSYEYRDWRMQDCKQFKSTSGYEEFPEISNLFMESGQCYGATDTIMPYGNPQVNLLPYPTLVFVPQHALQYSGAAASIYLSTSSPEIFQLIPAPICCVNGQQ